jgi:hypothetical protein
VLRNHRLAFLVGVFFCFERTRARNPNKFIVVRVPLYDNPTVMACLLHHQSHNTLVAYAFVIEVVSADFLSNSDFFTEGSLRLSAEETR